MHLQPLTNKLQEKARKELNEIPSQREANLRHIKDWLKKQPHLKARTDDLWILNFLRGCKFSLERTKEKIDNYYTTRSLFRELFEHRDPLVPEVQSILDRNIIIPLETEDSLNVIVRWKNADSNNVSFLALLKVAFMFLDVFLYESNTCMVTGYHIIDDLQDFSISYLQQCTPTVLKKLLLTMQNGYPLRVKGIHCVNAPAHVKPLINICKPMISQKIQNRLHIYRQGEFKRIHKYVPSSVLPKEYGGEGSSVDDIGAQWKKKLEAYRLWFLEDAQYCCDETKRLGKQKTSSNVFGVEGSFRKLELD